MLIASKNLPESFFFEIKAINIKKLQPSIRSVEKCARVLPILSRNVEEFPRIKNCNPKKRISTKICKIENKMREALPAKRTNRKRWLKVLPLFNS